MNDKLKKLNNTELALWICNNIPGYTFHADHNELSYRLKTLWPVHMNTARGKMEGVISNFLSGNFFKSYLQKDLGLTADRAEELEEALFALHSALCKLDERAIRAVEDISIDRLLSTMAKSAELRDVAGEMMERKLNDSLPF